MGLLEKLKEVYEVKAEKTNMLTEKALRERQVQAAAHMARYDDLRQRIEKGVAWFNEHPEAKNDLAMCNTWANLVAEYCTAWEALPIKTPVKEAFIMFVK